MADTVLTELKIHEFDSVEQMSQYESEIGENDMVYTPDTSIRLPILTPMWFDHQVNDESWLNADTFSWQSGDVYKAAYEHLVADCENAQTTTYYAWTGEGVILGTQDTVYTTSQTPAVGDAVYMYSDGDIYATTAGTITSSSSASIAFKYAVDGTTRSAFAYSGEVQLPIHLETIAGVTIDYCLSQDGHKITMNEAAVMAIYEATGVAWHYLLDQTNQQFKLPRTKWGFTGLRDNVGGYVEPALPNITGSLRAYAANITGAFRSTATGQQGGRTDASNTANISFSASDSSPIYKDGATVQPPATQMRLYFWVGAFDQTATEQTAGLNAEMFNGKADRDLGNIPTNYDYVVESQLPTADNGYTWYRKYKSGWVEQGGISTGTGTRSVTLPIVMASSNYNISAMAARANADAITATGYGTRTTTKFNMEASTINHDNYTWNSAANVIWQVSGMSAQ